MKKIILILLFIGYTASFAQSQEIKIHFIDIGGGDAILIQAEDKYALIDTGSLLSGYKLLDYLRQNNITSLNQLIITHPDPDHLGGIFFLLPKLKAKSLYDNGCDLNTPGNPLLEYYEKIFRSKENYKAVKEGDILKLGKVTLKIIWPINSACKGSFNHCSLVTMLEYRNFSCLLTADIDKLAEAELLKKGIKLNADVLKVAHHGAQDASSEDFLKKVKPKIAVISVDENNPRGYPAKSILDRLTTEKIKTYSTNRNGSITIRIDKQGKYTISAER